MQIESRAPLGSSPKVLMARSSRIKKQKPLSNASDVANQGRSDREVDRAPNANAANAATTEQQADNLFDSIDANLAGAQSPEPPQMSNSLLQSLCMINTMLTQLNDKQQEFHRQQSEWAQMQGDLEPREEELRELERELFERSEALDADAQRIAEAEQQLQQRQAKTSQQRRLIAQQLRAQRAEVALARRAGDMDLDAVREEFDAELERRLADQASQHEQQLEEKLAEARVQEAQQQEQKLAELRSRLEAEHEQALTDLRSQHQAEREQSLADLRSQHAAEQEQALADLQSQRDQHQSLADERSQWDAEREQAVAEVRAQLDEDLKRALAHVEAERDACRRLEAELELTRQKLQAIEADRETTGDSGEANATLQAAVDGLRKRRDEAEDEIEELRSQNRELAAKLAASQVDGAGTDGQVSLESMSWEQRKLHMLQRLNAEDDELNDSELAQQRLKIEEVIDKTDRELSKRDAEIAELRCLLEQQSMAAGDMAIGGAAVLQMLDQDELIQEERAKLQRIQAEWEEKLRQAEIDVSLERAKLARERIDIEQRLAEMREATKAEGKPESKGRKWLAQLGLTDGE
ncbi:hypothetical protein CA51_19400 [Rosistilla oblonga]|nr:hypothetical protein CA51_19400 [Rosistilla oblonga]